jgi:hypothetical protein
LDVEGTVMKSVYGLGVDWNEGHENLKPKEALAHKHKAL